MEKGTILFVSHDTASVKNLCNRAIWLDHGQLLQEGSPKEVCEKYLEKLYEELQGSSKVALSHKKAKTPDYSKAVDQRQPYINHSNLRNDLRIFKFNADSAAFGKGGVTIQHVFLSDESGNPISWVVGGEKVCLEILADVHIDLDSPIAGFWVNDRLGQIIFGDNSCITYLNNSFPICAGSVLRAQFVFYMPILPVGDYSLMVSIANGDQQDHVQHHWIHDAIIFKSESSSVALGLVGIPMIKIEISKE